MRNTETAQHKRHVQDTHFEAQMKIVFQAFYNSPKTMLMVSFETGILRANICRYVAEWRKYDKIAVAKRGLCPITRFPAGFYTTDPALFPTIPQIPELFPEDSELPNY